MAPFVDRQPTFNELEWLRLILSTYQDGSGMLVPKSKRGRQWMEQNNAITLPGWRDFERSVAAALGGIGTESKFIYDVVLGDQHTDEERIGISCKMRSELRKVTKQGRASIEVANASGEFWDTIKRQTRLNEDNYMSAPALIGAVLLTIVEGWHKAATSSVYGRISQEKSFYLNLLWDSQSGEYLLLQFPIHLPDAAALKWSVAGRRLIGCDDKGVVLEWYGHSGGQLKYYPQISQALWMSNTFRLEPLPANPSHLLTDKAAAYFPGKWPSM